MADGFGGGSPSEGCVQCTGTAPSTQATAGETVNPATGDVRLAATDLTLPGAGIPLAFTRTYDAQAAQAEEAAGTAPPLGYGWSDNLNMTLAYNLTTQAATITEEDGAQVVFVPNPSGSPPYGWCPPSASANYCPTSPRVAATLNHPSPTGPWTFTRSTGTQETFTFDSTGALTQITDPALDTLKATTYSPGTGQTACPSGNTCTVWTSSASGLELVVAVNTASGRMTSVFDALAHSRTRRPRSCTRPPGARGAEVKPPICARRPIPTAWSPVMATTQGTQPPATTTTF